MSRITLRLLKMIKKQCSSLSLDYFSRLYRNSKGEAGGNKIIYIPDDTIKFSQVNIRLFFIDLEYVNLNENVLNKKHYKAFLSITTNDGRLGFFLKTSSIQNDLFLFFICETPMLCSDMM